MSLQTNTFSAVLFAHVNYVTDTLPYALTPELSPTAA